MKFRTYHGPLAAASVAALLLLSACGGGGDGGAPVAADSGTGSGGTGSGDSGSSGAGGNTGGTVATFTIGGSISGLTATGLALSNNGTDRLDVASSATTFKFATKIASGSAYSVGFDAYPSGQVCSLSGQSGTVSADVTSVAILCADWTAATATVSSAAGGVQGYADGPAASAQFWWPYGLAVDASGTIFVAERDNNLIRKISAGVVTTLAGATGGGYLDDTGTSALFNGPRGIAVDAAGNAYVADTSNQKIRKITPAGVVTTLAGSTQGHLDDTGLAARFSNPWGLAVDSGGNLFVADQGNNRIRKITPAGVVTTFAGTGSTSLTNGPGASAEFNAPSGLAIDADDNLYVGDYGNNAIRKITPAGVVTTLAGNGAAGALDGTGAAATFDWPIGLAVDSGGTVYVADYANHIVRKVTPTGDVTTLAGVAAATGNANGSGTVARFSAPIGVAADRNGDLYVADRNNNQIRKIARTP